MTKIIALGALAALLVLAFQNCGPMVEEAPPNVAHLDSLFLKVRDSAGLQCLDSSDCQQLPVGEKACGGPHFYLVYSTRDTDVERLSELINELNQYEMRLNASGMASTCDLALPFTSLACENQQCVGKFDMIGTIDP